MVELNRYTLRFSGNGNTSGNVPITQSVETEDASYTFTIPEDNNLLKTNYGFVGWSENPNNTSIAEYRPGSTIILDEVNPQVTLYAIWYPGLHFINTMQEMTSDICKLGTVIGETKSLIDIRDDKSYWVTKLKDGNCWMTQNLDLDISVTKTLTEADTDFIDSTTKSWTPTDNTITSTLNNTLWPPYTNNIVRSWDPALGGNPTYCNNGSTAGICKNTGNPTSSVNNKHDAQGNYYSWAAATAGQASSLTSTSTTVGQEATQSICPKGWRLPYGNSYPGSFRVLTNTYEITSGTANGSSDANLLKAPLYFVRGGRVGGGELTNAGVNGHYWSSTTNGASAARSLAFSVSDVRPISNGIDERYYGFSVRCVAR